jgi:hypothetical protein
MDVLKLLERDDKWYLGGGDSLIFTPLFPEWLHVPGLWDEAHFYNIPIKPLHTISILSDDGRVIRPHLVDKIWRPSHLQRRFFLTDGFSLLETDVMLPGDILVSILRFENEDIEKDVDIIVWTAQVNGMNEKITSISHDEEGFLFKKERHLWGKYPLTLSVFLGMEHSTYSVNLSETTANQPLFEYTPFYEKFNGELPREIHNGWIESGGLLYFGLHKHLRIDKNKELKIFMSVARDCDKVKEQVRNAFEIRNPVKESEKNWQDFFNSVPSFECSDKYIEKFYWYRWYGLRLFMMQKSYPYPCICEGPAYFRVPISYSAQCHMLETRWMDNPKVAEGSFLNFVKNQEKNGSYPGHIYPVDIKQRGFYHADFGSSVIEVFRVHPDTSLLEIVYPSLVRYAEYFDRERDREHTHLYDVIDQWETGQEFMPRYTSVGEKTDIYKESGRIRLKGVDATCYQYGIRKALFFIAKRIGREKEAKRWKEEAKRIKDAILENMWDPEEEMFFDINPKTGKRTGVKAAVCFYPYMSDIIDESHLNGLKKHLLNGHEFWTPYPVPSTSMDESLANQFGEWKGKRMNCPWNGRVWPMTNSHIAEALANVAYEFDGTLRKTAGWFIERFIKMMFLDGDPRYPNTYEHYNPYTSRPCLYRGVNDYQHSWVIDLIIKYICGIQPQDDNTLIVDPLPLELGYFRIDNVPYKGHRIKVELKGDRFVVFVDGAHKSEGAMGKPVTIIMQKSNIKM